VKDWVIESKSELFPSFSTCGLGQAIREAFVTLGGESSKTARRCPASSQDCGEPQEICEGIDLASTREEIKIVKLGAVEIDRA
jgi:hypothetical protein